MTDLARIVELAQLLVEQKARFEDLEERTKDAKAALMRTEREDLPMLMAEAGLQELRLADGSLVSIKEDCDAGISEANRPAAMRWLESNGFGGLIKTKIQLALDRGNHEEAVALRDQLAQTHPEVELKEEVHHSTLKAFVKEQLASGKAIPMDLFSVHPYSKATIKKGK